MTILGEFQTRIAFDCQYYRITFLVVKGRAGNLLGYESVTKMGMVRIINNIKAKQVMENVEHIEMLKAKYPNAYLKKLAS